jgi:hypothetical protein
MLLRWRSAELLPVALAVRSFKKIKLEDFATFFFAFCVLVFCQREYIALLSSVSGFGYDFPL